MVILLCTLPPPHPSVWCIIMLVKSEAANASQAMAEQTIQNVYIP